MNLLNDLNHLVKHSGGERKGLGGLSSSPVFFSTSNHLSDRRCAALPALVWRGLFAQTATTSAPPLTLNAASTLAATITATFYLVYDRARSDVVRFRAALPVWRLFHCGPQTQGPY